MRVNNLFGFTRIISHKPLTVDMADDYFHLPYFFNFICIYQKIVLSLQYQIKKDNRTMEIKITKRQLAKEVNNDMVHNFYYYVQGRIINDDNTKFKRFGFVVFFDIFDVQDFSEKDVVNKRDIIELLNHCIANNLSYIKSYNDCKEFYELCNQSIENYNRICNY